MTSEDGSKNFRRSFSGEVSGLFLAGRVVSSRVVRAGTLNARGIPSQQDAWYGGVDVGGLQPEPVSMLGPDAVDLGTMDLTGCFCTFLVAPRLYGRDLSWTVRDLVDQGVRA